MLADPGDAKARAEAVKFLTELAGARKLARADLESLVNSLASGEGAVKPAARWLDAAHKLSAKAAPLARDAGKDLAALLPELPDATLAADWEYLCKEMARDLAPGAAPALARLESARRGIVSTANARLVEVGAAANQHAVADELAALIKAVPAATFA
jgi:hypothetical protein